MQDDFQPEKPYPSEEPTAGRYTVPWVALLSALGTVMLLAVLTPRLFEAPGISWAVTLGAGVLVFVTVLLIGFLRGRERQTRETPDGDDLSR